MSRTSLAGVLLAATALSATPSMAQTTVSQTPLAKAASQSIPPNLLYLLDDSGSMMQQYTPDYVSERWSGSAPQFKTSNGSTGDRHCRDSWDDGASSSSELCLIGDPPYMAGAFNRQYYNPSIRYTPGNKSDGTSYDSMTTGKTSAWTAVPTDAYGKQNTDQLEQSNTTVNLVTNYPDRVWCKSNSDTPSGSNCVKNGPSYTYPDATYQYGRGSGGFGGNSTGSSGNIKYVYGAPYYYEIKPLYCTDENATSCSNTKGGSYLIEHPYRWCSSTSFTSCQARKTSTYYLPSFLEPETSVAPVLSFKIGGYSSGTKNVSSVKVNGIERLTSTATHSDSGSSTTNCTALAGKVAALISASNGFTATSSGCTVTMTSTTTGTTNSALPAVTGSASISNESIDVAGKDGFARFNRVNIVASTAKYQVDGVKPAGRTDCTTYSDGCTYAEEMTNFANWYSYYRTRLQMMKTSTSQAFVSINDAFRIGFTTINKLKDNYITIKGFDSTQRSTWYTKMLGTVTSGSTPLREALAFAGRVYAGKKPSSITDDPVQYSCQQNFTLLTTDGYWNGDAGVQVDGSTAIGDQDSNISTAPRPFYQGASGASDSLSDVAMYYYNTDLRSSALGNCTSALTGADVCEDNVPISADDKNSKQHMTTFTLGLGVDGQVQYRKDYKTATSGDFYKIKSGTMDWPKPASGSETAVDDLWHAAVNGRGQYFSAKDPAVLVSSLKEALAGVSAQFGSGAAAATSNLEPVSGDNYAYVASYTTGKWIGNLEARSIDTSSGAIGKQALWCAENVPADTAAGTTACSGTLTDKVAATTDTRKIYFAKAGALTDFTPSNLTATQKAAFDVTKLNQYVGWTTEYKTTATADLMINYLRGQWGYDGRASNVYRLFREREAVLGDLVGSKPTFVCKPYFDYEDSGYAAYKSSFISGSDCTRTPAVYIGGNDGMLHAFDAKTGAELWAFIPTPVLSELWRLSDSTYTNNHRFFVDGAPSIADVCISGCASGTPVWKTILIAGMNAGVVTGSDPDTGAANSGFFALDITDPSTPKLLWEFTSSTAGYSGKVGFSFGNPVVGKVKDSSGNDVWAALITSGYKTATGTAHLFVLNAYTGAMIRAANLPSEANGLARISALASKPNKDNSLSYAYGGDLAGNVWRVNPNDGTVARVVSNLNQPITARPEIALCNNKPVVYVGTGKFFEASDLTDKTQQSFYGFLDEYDTAGTITTPRSSYEKLSISGSGGKRTIGSSNGTKKGWYVDMPDTSSGGGSERINVDPQLVSGSLIFASNVPDSGICLAGGHSWVNSVQMSACSSSDNFPPVTGGESANLGNALAVGLVVLKLPGGFVVNVTLSNDPTPVKVKDLPVGSSENSPLGRRVGWRELIRD